MGTVYSTNAPKHMKKLINKLMGRYGSNEVADERRGQASFK